MRITALELAPYGHLARARLELPMADSGPGLHVLMGTNGAGKSTSLRALDGALFGISRRTGDAHTHPGPALKIGLSLEREDGEILSFERRKREKQSLSAPDGTVIDEAILRECLGGLPPEELRAMFLLDCKKLEEGSEDLLNGRGLLGEALFGAALGLGRVHQILNDLDSEAEALWIKGGARTLNHQLKAFGEARREKRKSGLNPETWMSIGRELEDAEQKLLAIKKIHSELSESVGRAERHERCLRPLALRRLTLEALEELPDIPEVPAAYTTEVRAAQEELHESSRGATERQRELKEVEDELKAQPDVGEIIDHEDAVNTLYQRAGESKKASKDLPRREALLTERRNGLLRLLAKVRPDQNLDSIDTMRVTAADRARLVELTGERAALGQAHEDATSAHDRLRQRAELHHQAAPSVPDVSQAAQDTLANTIEGASEAGDLDTIASEERGQAQNLRETAEREWVASEHWDIGIDELAQLKVPSPANVKAFTKELAGLEQAHERLAERALEIQARADVLQRDHDTLAADQPPPTREALAAARSARDDAIDTLIEAPSPDGARATLVRTSVRNADTLADTRAEHAETAAALERLQRDRVTHAKARTQLAADVKAHEQLTANYETRWNQAWRSLPTAPGMPEAMLEWLANRAAILEKLNAAREHEARAERAEATIKRHRDMLNDAQELSASDTSGNPSLGATMRTARSTLAAIVLARSEVATHAREESRLEEELTEAANRVSACERTLAQWKDAWKTPVRALGLSDEATPAQAMAQLTVIDELVAAYDSASTLEERIASIRDDQERFTRDAQQLASTLAPDLDKTDGQALAEALHRRVAVARSALATRGQLEPREHQLKHQIQTSARARANANEALGKLAERTNVDPDALEGLCDTIDSRAALRDELKQATNELEALGGQAAAELESALAEATPERLAAERAAAEDELHALEEQRGELERTAGRLRAQLDEGGGDEAALAGEREAQARAAVINGFERYTELTLAAAALRAAMDRHRHEHQGPLLKRAGELFARLSAGRMIGLTAVTTEHKPYIMGVLPDQREVPVEGMSSGQRHQLFLALRLASLERHFERSEPMPLVLDDLLVQLDNPSARAALLILSELARTTQVLFFTHHEHLAEMARETVPAELLIEHQVGTETRSTLRAA